MNSPNSDLLSGYITYFDPQKDCFGLKTAAGKEWNCFLSPISYGKMLQNLDESYCDVTDKMRSLLTPGRFLYAYGISYPPFIDFDIKSLVFLGYQSDEYVFEKPNWWINQVRCLADFYLTAQFGTEEINYRNYRTYLSLSGIRSLTNFSQETDTISRLVYGFATAYLLTGEEPFLEAAEKGTEYLREHMRFYDADEEIVYWYHGINVQGKREQKIFASEFGDDYHAIPAYEQIYALAGLVQTFRITGDPLILRDSQLTVKLFNQFFKDQSPYGGYFSHIDPITLDPHSETLKGNQSRKNWNSIGDHAPAYLINLWLATGETEYLQMLEDVFDTVVKYFPDYENSPLVQEKFHANWSPDTTWGWQQNRGVVGHNLKIAWNLMRMYSIKPKAEYLELACQIGDIMPGVGSDRSRGGWYDVLERLCRPGEDFHRFVWHDRKAWWQQEQAILAYYLLAGLTKNPDYHRLARESAAFYNAWFLDVEEGGVYFNVLANGVPFLSGGNERGKGSHSMSGYHSTELCYLAAVYTNLLIYRQPMDFYFKPLGNSDRTLRVSPDILPHGSIIIGGCEIEGEVYSNYDPQKLTVTLPDLKKRLKVKVTLVPSAEADF
ncbi:AGE family epimerase/isomerase [Gloeocapsa sp. PCC 73106]|uniref:AGE family epimerase/isomerase n=1 Tax=Gloeocapsa sp. PCC 73106 TaxID=102232 RepID=UPI0002ABA9F6|nr:AGE family epimerase/isomerase [Gloeocapsa sp. PCC 73106]ELR97551.1 N-acyl-D-glucosamine 2-epimerase [Gloeocapsa sp. PCC 73106]